MRVLIIDDNEDSSFLLSRLVEHCGHEVKTASVPQQALELATGWQPRFVFVDLAMPEMDGYTLSQQLRQRAGLNDARIYALSGYPQNVQKQQVAGLDGHLLKPIGLKQIEALLGC